MSAVTHREAVVGPGGKIEISAPELQPGQRVSITIEPEQPTGSQSTEPTLYDLVKNLPGGLLFKTAEEVDAYMREERDSWDR